MLSSHSWLLTISPKIPGSKGSLLSAGFRKGAQLAGSFTIWNEAVPELLGAVQPSRHIAPLWAIHQQTAMELNRSQKVHTVTKGTNPATTTTTTVPDIFPTLLSPKRKTKERVHWAVPSSRGRMVIIPPSPCHLNTILHPKHQSYGTFSLLLPLIRQELSLFKCPSSPLHTNTHSVANTTSCL